MPDDDVHAEISVDRKGITPFHLVKDWQALWCLHYGILWKRSSICFCATSRRQVHECWAVVGHSLFGKYLGQPSHDNFLIPTACLTSVG